MPQKKRCGPVAEFFFVAPIANSTDLVTTTCLKLKRDFDGRDRYIYDLLQKIWKRGKKNILTQDDLATLQRVADNDKDYILETIIEGINDEKFKDSTPLYTAKLAKFLFSLIVNCGDDGVKMKSMITLSFMSLNARGKEILQGELIANERGRVALLNSIDDTNLATKRHALTIVSNVVSCIELQEILCKQNVFESLLRAVEINDDEIKKYAAKSLYNMLNSEFAEALLSSESINQKIENTSFGSNQIEDGRVQYLVERLLVRIEEVREKVIFNNSKQEKNNTKRSYAAFDQDSEEEESEEILTQLERDDPRSPEMRAQKIMKKQNENFSSASEDYLIGSHNRSNEMGL